MSVLVVDNDANASKLLQQMLRGFGIQSIAAAASGAEALTDLRAGPFDLCIIDAALPDMSAAGLVRGVRALPPPMRATPILVLTGHSNMREITEARDAGAHLVVRKPLSPRVLFDRITWVATASRGFVEDGPYVGPDRRFKSTIPPPQPERRKPRAKPARPS